MTASKLVRTDELHGMGPAMRALPDDRMRDFVSVIVETGCSLKDAAERAGYPSTSPNGLRIKGHRLSRDPMVQAAPHEESLKVLRVDGVLCIKYLREIAGDKNNKAADRLKAIEMTLSRSGFASTTQHSITVTHKSDEQLKQELLAMAEELGLDAIAKQRLIGGPVIDADFVEVPKPPRPPSENDPAYQAAKAKARSDRLAREAADQTPTTAVSNEDVPTNPEPEGTEP